MIATRSILGAIGAIGALLAAAAPPAAGAPAADVVVVWAPDHDVAPLAAAAREAGAALIDRSPRAAAPESPDAAIRRGIESYDALQLDRRVGDLRRGARGDRPHRRGGCHGRAALGPVPVPRR